MIRIENVCPVLGTTDLERTKAFFAGLLGFELDWGFEPGSHIGALKRDGVAIMFSKFATPGATIWIGVDDIVPIHQILNENNVKILQPPTNQPWAYDFVAEDPDGNILWFGSGPLPMD